MSTWQETYVLVVWLDIYKMHILLLATVTQLALSIIQLQVVERLDIIVVTLLHPFIMIIKQTLPLMTMSARLQPPPPNYNKRRTTPQRSSLGGTSWMFGIRWHLVNILACAGKKLLIVLVYHSQKPQRWSVKTVQLITSQWCWRVNPPVILSYKSVQTTPAK